MRDKKGGAMIKILWMSQHKPLPKQIAELRKIFGSTTEVEQDPRPFSSAEEIVKRYKEGGYGDMVVVAPLSVISRLVDLGIKPLWCDMEFLKSAEGADVSFRGRHYKFLGFKRIKMVRLEFEAKI
jgi:hypothetical protein